VATPAQATIPVAASDDVALRMRVYKENAAEAKFMSYGNGSKRPLVAIDADEKVEYYYNGSYYDTGVTVASDSWHLIEIRNIIFATGKFDIYVNNALAKSEADMHEDNVSSGVNRLYGDPYSADNDYWVDDFIVRNYRTTEPAWGAWGAEEEDAFAEESISISTTMTPEQMVDAIA
jgi:hypothetical protein